MGGGSSDGEPSSGSPARRCPLHGLAASPDGTCARCRRTAPLTGALRLLALVCVLTITALGAYRAQRAHPDATAATPAPVAPPPVAPALAAAPEPPPPPPPPAPPPPRASPTPEPAPAVEAAPSDDTAARIAADEAYVAAARKQREDERSAAAMGSVQVVMYSTSWCGYCARARAWLGSHHVAFTEHDVEREPEARARQLTLSPRGGVPVIEVDGQVLRGFDADSLEHAIAQAAARRARRF